LVAVQEGGVWARPGQSCVCRHRFVESAFLVEKISIPGTVWLGFLPRTEMNALLTRQQLGTPYGGWAALQPLYQRIVKERPDLLH